MNSTPRALSALDRLWQALLAWPRASVALIAAAQTLFVLNHRALWFSDEVRYADAYLGLLRGKWLVLNLNGVAYPDKPPVYFWFVWLLDRFTALGDPAAFFLAAGASGLLMVWATMRLGRVLGLSAEVRLGAGLVLLSTLFFAGLLHYSRMDLLFAALITAAQAEFCLAFAPKQEGAQEASRTRRATLALLICGVATLTKGPLGLVFPVLATVLFLAWRGRAREFFSRALLPGLLALLGLVAAWVAAAYFVEGYGFLHKIFYEQIFLRATKTFHHAEPAWFYLVAFPPCWLPWTLALFSLPVGRLITPGFWAGVWAGRKASPPQSDAPGNDARTWLWISAASGLGLLSLLSGKVVVYILPQLAPLALLMAWGLLEAHRPWKRLWTLSGLLFLALAVAATQAARFLPRPPAELLGAAVLPPDPLPGTWAVAACFALIGAALLALRRHDARRILPALALLVTLWVQPAGGLLAPALDPIMSPRPQALVLKDYAERGYLPVAHDIYQGIYSYYAGQPIRETFSFDALTPLASSRSIVLAIKKKRWDAWTDRPAHLRIVLTQWLAGTTYIVAVGEAPGAASPAATFRSPDRLCCVAKGPGPSPAQ